MTLRVKPEQIGKGDNLPLTTTQISAGRGADITFSKTQIGKTKKQIGGNLFFVVRALVPTVGKALGMAGLSFGAESV